MIVLASVPFAKRYVVSVWGDVYSFVSGRRLRPLVTPSGYTHVVLRCDDGVQRRLATHVVVLETFVKSRPTGLVANHINGSKADNRASNLEWVEQSENVRHAYRLGLRTINDAHRARCAALGRAKRRSS
jgi:hypothetical protein